MTADSVDHMIGRWAATDPAVDARPLEVVGRLLLCARHLQNDLVAALRPLGVSFGDFDVINTLRRLGDDQGTNARDLASAALVTSGAMTIRLDRLEQAGLVTRTPDPGDGRAVRVHLTPRGDDLARRALAAVIAADEAFLAPLSERQRDTVAAGLRRLLAPYER